MGISRFLAEYYYRVLSRKRDIMRNSADALRVAWQFEVYRRKIDKWRKFVSATSIIMTAIPTRRLWCPPSPPLSMITKTADTNWLVNFRFACQHSIYCIVFCPPQTSLLLYTAGYSILHVNCIQSNLDNSKLRRSMKIFDISSFRLIRVFDDR